MWHHRSLPSSLSGIILFLIITEKIEIVLYHHHVIIVIIIFLNLPGYLIFIHLYRYILLYSIQQDAMAICLNSNPVSIISHVCEFGPVFHLGVRRG